MTTELEFSFDHPVFGQELLGGNGYLARASWVAKRIREDDIFHMQDGTLSQLLFKEVLSSFVAGQYIAAIVLGFSLIERTVAGRLAFIGDNDAALAKSEDLLKNAFDRKWLKEEEYDLLNKLRKVRNPIVHFRDPLSESRPEVRAASTAQSTIQILEEDAKCILDAAIRVLGKTAL